MIKYPSIENTYQTKVMSHWLEEFPNLKEERFIVTEKLHGANFQILFSPEDPMRYFSRNRELFSGDKFYGYQNIINADLISFFQQYSTGNKEEVAIFGELIGPGIMKGVNYGPEKSFRIFDIYLDGEVIPFGEYVNKGLLTMVSKYMVPVISHDASYEDAFNIDVETILSSIVTISGNIAEGVVIKPRNKVYKSRRGSTFIWKKKNSKFKEKAEQKKEYVQDPLNAEFLKYINENRVLSVFSKHGEIETPQDIGKYVKLVTEDAFGDFIKDFSEEYEQHENKRGVINASKNIVSILKKYL